MPLGEGMSVLDLAENIVKKGKYLASGKVVICTDNKGIINRIENKVNKENQSALEAGATIKGIKEEMMRPSIDLTFYYSKPNPKDDLEFL